jgi:hypothetical protein
MQQEHRIILTTLCCRFGSWAPAQVTAPCGADSPRAASDLARRPGSALRRRPRRAREDTGRTHPRSRTHTTFVRRRRGPHRTRDATSSHARRVVPRRCRRRHAAAARPGPGSGPRPPPDPSGWTTSAPRWGGRPWRRDDVVAGHDPHCARTWSRRRYGRAGGRLSGRETRDAPTRRRPAPRDEFHRCDEASGESPAVRRSVPLGTERSEPDQVRDGRADASPRPEVQPTTRRRATLPRSRPRVRRLTSSSPSKQARRARTTSWDAHGHVHPTRHGYGIRR